MVPDDFRAAVSIELHDLQTAISVDPEASPRWRAADAENAPTYSDRQITTLYAHIEAPHLLHIRMVGRDSKGHEWADDITYCGSFTIWWSQRS